MERHQHFLTISGLLFLLSSSIALATDELVAGPSQSGEHSANENVSGRESEENGMNPKIPMDIQTKSKVPTQVNSTEDAPKSEGNTPKSGNKLGDFLGEMKPILEKATKAEAYLVGAQPVGEEVPDESQLGGYQVLKEPVVLTAELLKQAQALVLDEKSYFWGPPHKKCMLAPKVALRFIKGNEEVSVLFSTYCNMWSFIYQDKLNTQDYAPAAEVINKLLSTLFPDEFSTPTQPSE